MGKLKGVKVKVVTGEQKVMVGNAYPRESTKNKNVIPRDAVTQ
jgi:hypothetical protein